MNPVTPLEVYNEAVYAPKDEDSVLVSKEFFDSLRAQYVALVNELKMRSLAESRLQDLTSLASSKDKQYHEDLTKLLAIIKMITKDIKKIDVKNHKAPQLTSLTHACDQLYNLNKLSMSRYENIYRLILLIK